MGQSMYVCPIEVKTLKKTCIPLITPENAGGFHRFITRHMKTIKVHLEQSATVKTVKCN